MRFFNRLPNLACANYTLMGRRSSNSGSGWLGPGAQHRKNNWNGGMYSLSGKFLVDNGLVKYFLVREFFSGKAGLTSKVWVIPLDRQLGPVPAGLRARVSSKEQLPGPQGARSGISRGGNVDCHGEPGPPVSWFAPRLVRFRK